MKRQVPLVLILAGGVASIAWVQRKHISTQPSPQFLLAAAADAQYELTRAPARGDRMTDAEEIAIGDALAKRVSASLHASTANRAHDSATEEYLQRVGSRVATHARRKLPWTFHYVPSTTFVNAFALPGGHVFVGEGLLQLMQSEDALAAVLGHEVEHIDLRHCAERSQVEARLRQLGTIGDLASIPTEIFISGYSKEQELDADRDGTILAVQSGYSYKGILQLLGTFSALETRENSRMTRPNGPVGEALQLSVSTLSGYFSSHPPSSQRAERIRELADERKWPAGEVRTPSRPKASSSP